MVSKSVTILRKNLEISHIEVIKSDFWRLYLIWKDSFEDSFKVVTLEEKSSNGKDIVLETYWINKKLHGLIKNKTKD